MDMSTLMGNFENKKADFYDKSIQRELGKDFDELLQEAMTNPETAAYLDLQMTKEQAIGYLIAAIRSDLSHLKAEDRALIVEGMEMQFLKLRPEEAERIYAESWYKNG